MSVQRTHWNDDEKKSYDKYRLLHPLGICRGQDRATQIASPKKKAKALLPPSTNCLFNRIFQSRPITNTHSEHGSHI
jgi:hypothetical protein